MNETLPHFGFVWHIYAMKTASDFSGDKLCYFSEYIAIVQDMYLSWWLLVLLTCICQRLSHLNYRFGLGYFSYQNCSPSKMFLHLGRRLEHCIEHVTLTQLYIRFIFSTRIFYTEIPCFTSNCLCGVWCRRVITCLMYVGPLFGNHLPPVCWSFLATAGW